MSLLFRGSGRLIPPKFGKKAVFCPIRVLSENRCTEKNYFLVNFVHFVRGSVRTRSLFQPSTHERVGGGLQYSLVEPARTSPPVFGGFRGVRAAEPLPMVFASRENSISFIYQGGQSLFFLVPAPLGRQNKYGSSKTLYPEGVWSTTGEPLMCHESHMVNPKKHGIDPVYSFPITTRAFTNHITSLKFMQYNMSRFYRYRFSMCCGTTHTKSLTVNPPLYEN